MGGEVSTVEKQLAMLARRSHGIVTRAQLLRIGITARQIERRVERGTLLLEHRGVYRVGHRAPSVEARYMAAVRAGGNRALLSGQAAAYLLGISKGRPPEPEVTVPTERRIPGVNTRRSKLKDRTVWKGIPVTTAARTLVDLAAVLDEAELARACHEAGVRHHTTPSQVEAVLARRRRAPGAAKLRAVMSGGARVALSKLETGALALLRRNDLPLPRETNRLVGEHRVDFRWPAHRLTVELDGFRFHNSRHSWEQDRRRERDAYARGDDLRRYTYADVFEHPAAMLAELRALLQR
jgi:very-short-patch-repair endonuclease